MKPQFSATLEEFLLKVQAEGIDYMQEMGLSFPERVILQRLVHRSRRQENKEEKKAA